MPVAFRVRRITGSGNVWVSEVSASYDGGPWMLGVGVLEFDGLQVQRERIYVTEPSDVTGVAPVAGGDTRSSQPTLIAGGGAVRAALPATP